MNARYCIEVITDDAERVSESLSHLSSIVEDVMKDIISQHENGCFVAPKFARDRFPYGTTMDKLFLNIDRDVLNKFRSVCGFHGVSMAKIVRRELRALASLYEVV